MPYITPKTSLETLKKFTSIKVIGVGSKESY